jgi:hypothetical protein
MDICGYEEYQQDMSMDSGWISMDLKWISFDIQGRYPLISKTISFDIHKRYP